jgi:hypothetical protein
MSKFPRKIPKRVAELIKPGTHVAEYYQADFGKR